MTILQNISEAIRSIMENKLRTGLTVALIAIGITSLVGILTAIDSIQQTLTSGLGDLGANSFNIEDKESKRSTRRGGFRERSVRIVEHHEVQQFIKRFESAERLTAYTTVKFNAEFKHGSKKTNPNSIVIGTDQHYIFCKSGTSLGEGRNFTPIEISHGVPVAIIGSEIADVLFENSSPLEREISLTGRKYKVIGVLEKKGSLGANSSADRSVLIPVANAEMLSDTDLSYVITVISKPEKMDNVMEEARGLMRQIRHDDLGMPDSFNIERNETLAESLTETSGTLKIGGFLIGFLTLLGASVGLVNIMLVSVTERTREIGIRKAIGAAPRHIRTQFLIEAITICQIGGIMGVVVGIGIGNLVAVFIDSGKFMIPWAWVIMGMGTCLVVGIISGFYPAYKASLLDPIESLRYE